MNSARRPTVYDVAEQAHVSIATVSFAFNRPEQISTATRARVLEVARELGYMPSASARGLARGRTGALGLHSFDFLIERALDEEPNPNPAGLSALPVGDSFIPWDDTREDLSPDPRAFPLYVDEVRRGFELECRASERPVMLTGGRDTTTALAETAGRVDGLAVFPGYTYAESLARIELKIPIVLFSVPPADDGHHRVVADNAGGMRALIRHIVLAHRVTDLAFVGRLDGPDHHERFTAFQSTLAELGLPAPDDTFGDTTAGAKGAYEAVLDAHRRGQLPRALICATDQLALSLLVRLNAEGVRVPDDVIVTGFDGILAGKVSTPSLTTVRQPMVSMGRAAAKLLIQSTRSKHPSSPTVLRLGTQLVTRESCGCGE